MKQKAFSLGGKKSRKPTNIYQDLIEEKGKGHNAQYQEGNGGYHHRPCRYQSDDMGVK